MGKYVTRIGRVLKLIAKKTKSQKPSSMKPKTFIVEWYYTHTDMPLVSQNPYFGESELFTTFDRGECSIKSVVEKLRVHTLGK